MTGHSPGITWPVGRLLLERSLATLEQITSCELEAESLGVRPIFALVANGVIEGPKLAQLLCYEFSTIWVSLTDSTIPTSVKALIPREIAIRYQVVPVWLDTRNAREPVLRVAAADPSDQEAVEACAQASGYVTQLVVATPQVIFKTLQNMYSPTADELPDLFVEDFDVDLLEEDDSSPSHVPDASNLDSSIPAQSPSEDLPPPPPPPKPRMSTIPLDDIALSDLPPPPPPPPSIPDLSDLTGESESPEPDAQSEHPPATDFVDETNDGDGDSSSENTEQSATVDTSNDSSPTFQETITLREVIVVGATPVFRQHCEKVAEQVDCQFRYLPLMSLSAEVAGSAQQHVAAFVVPEDVYAFDCLRFNQMAMDTGFHLIVWPTTPPANGLADVLKKACRKASEP